MHSIDYVVEEHESPSNQPSSMLDTTVTKQARYQEQKEDHFILSLLVLALCYRDLDSPFLENTCKKLRRKFFAYLLAKDQHTLRAKMERLVTAYTEKFPDILFIESLLVCYGRLLYIHVDLYYKLNCFLTFSC